MVAALLDTAVIVDLLRGYPPAVIWLGQQGSLGVSSLVWLEIIEGAPNQKAQQVALQLLQRFERIEATAEDIDWGIRQLLRFHLRFGVDAMDCLIASANHRLGIPLYSHNLKHFTLLLGDLVQKPY